MIEGGRKSMKVILCTVALILALENGAFADPFDEGAAASKAGDHRKAIEIWRPWAEQGHSKAEFALGVTYDIGRGVVQDKAEAMKWFIRAAEHGHVGAQFSVGHAYFTGEGVKQDYVAASAWLDRAANQGDKFSQLILGGLYAQGFGGKKDLVQALKWLIVSAEGESVFREKASNNRDMLIKVMSAEQVAQARKLASEWTVKLERQSP